MDILNFSKQDLFNLIKENQSYQFIIMMFMVEWCRPCKRTIEVFGQFLEARKEKDILFLQINAEKNPLLSKDPFFAVSTVPRTFIFQNGKLWKQFEGSVDLYTLERFFLQL